LKKPLPFVKQKMKSVKTACFAGSISRRHRTVALFPIVQVFGWMDL